MPSRSDKRDSVALAAYLLGLQVDFIDGINGSEINPKAYPQVILAWTICNLLLIFGPRYGTWKSRQEPSAVGEAI